MVRPRALRAETFTEGTSPADRVSHISDGDLVERVSAGDRWAEEAIFRKHVTYVAALSMRLLRDRSEAEDVVQETFLDAFAALRGARAPSSLRGWLAGIAVHKVHRRFRKRRFMIAFGRRAVPDEIGLAAFGRANTSPELLAEIALVDAALAVVSDVDRAAWVLHHAEGYGLEDVARLCRCSLTTAKRRIRRAHAVVQAHVDFEYEGADG